jgi:CubicO group peptidase (beta-lactamase class C family)
MAACVSEPRNVVRRSDRLVTIWMVSHGLSNKNYIVVVVCRLCSNSDPWPNGYSAGLMLLMKKKLIALLLALLLPGAAQIPGLGQQRPDVEGVSAKRPAQTADVATRIRRVENGLIPPVLIRGAAPSKMALADRMRFYKVPGVSIAVVNHGAVEWAKGYGVKEVGGQDPVTARTLFETASISKTLTGLLVLRLVQEGKLQLDEDVNQKLRLWKVPENEFTKERKVTLRGLLSHTAGMNVGGFEPYLFDEQMPTPIQDLDGLKPSHTPPIRVEAVPGSRWKYSGGGYVVINQLLDDVTGVKFASLMKLKVLNVLGMNHSSYQLPLAEKLRREAASGHDEDGKVLKGKWMTVPELAAGGGWSTPSDLARVVIEIQRAASGQPSRIISKASANEMLTVQMHGYGLGVFLEGSGNALQFNHTGHNTGYRGMIIGHPFTGQGAVILTNGDSTGGALIFEIVRSIAREYGWSDYQAIERTAVKINPEVYRSYVGEYVGGGITFKVTSEGGNLYVLAPPLGSERLELYAESEAKYFVTVDNVTFTFVKDGAGLVTRLIVQPPDQTIVATRSNAGQ